MNTTGTPAPAAQKSKSNLKLALALSGFTCFMVGMSFAAVPLYRLFCQVTGYGGTTQRAEAPSSRVLDREITVRFDANISSDLGWAFRPAQNTMRLKIGENALAFYEAVNTSGAPLTGMATFNVTPEIAGSYFNKIECFCFIEQTLQPGQRVDMPVTFFVDPAIMDDPDASRIEEIVLSYTFFNKEPAGRSAAAPKADGAASRSFENDGNSG